MLMLLKKEHLCLVITYQERQLSSTQILSKLKTFYFQGWFHWTAQTLTSMNATLVRKSWTQKTKMGWAERGAVVWPSTRMLTLDWCTVTHSKATITMEEGSIHWHQRLIRLPDWSNKRIKLLILHQKYINHRVNYLLQGHNLPLLQLKFYWMLGMLSVQQS